MKVRFMQALLGLMLLTPAAASAADGDDASVDMLVLKLADETTAQFMLADKPAISFADGKLAVTSQSASTEYAQSDVTEFHFEKYDPSTAIGKTTGSQFAFAYSDNATVSITGTKAPKATLYTADGKLVKSVRTAGGSVTVSLADCQAGVYVLTLENEHTFKVIKK